jgi:hypothetical protein
VQSDGVHPFITTQDILGPDGSHKLRVTGYWKNILRGQSGFDPTFGGAQLVIQYNGDSNYYAIIAGTTAPITNDIQYPATATTANLFLRSVDVDGNTNSIVPGVTPADPSNPISIGGGTLLNLTYADPTFYDGTIFTIFGGLFKLLANSITSTYIGPNSISTGALQSNSVTTVKLTTSQIDVGGGGGRPIRIRLYDSLGSPVAWIGDDSAVSGFVGGWFKQLYVGGGNPSSAYFVADSSGNITITGNGSLGGHVSFYNVPMQFDDGTTTTSIDSATSGIMVQFDTSPGTFTQTFAGSFTATSPTHTGQLLAGEVIVSSGIASCAMTPGGLAVNGTAGFTGSFQDLAGHTHTVQAGIMLT